MVEVSEPGEQTSGRAAPDGACGPTTASPPGSLTSSHGDREASSDDAEMWCDRCRRRHGVVWFAPSEIWNAVMRDGDRGNPDEFGFCCPTCFMQLADDRRIGNHMWKIAPEVLGGSE